MTWHVHITEHTYHLLKELPTDTCGHVFALFRRLEDDPYATIAPFGIPDGRHYTAAWSHGVIVLALDTDRQRITPLVITAL